MLRSSRPVRLVLGVTVTALLAGGLASAFAADPTLGCSFPDAAGDASIPGGDGAPDKDLDLTRVGFTSTDTALVLSAKLVKLTNTGPDLFLGDDYEFDFSLNKKAFQVGATRIGDPEGGPPLEVAPYVYVNGTEMAATSLKAKYDVKASVVEVSISAADLSKLAAIPVEGASLSALTAKSFAYTGGGLERQSDVATAPPGTTWTYGGASCAGAGAGPAPTTAAASASPSPSASAAAPASGGGDAPTPGCVDIADAKGDASPNATNPGAPTPNDPDVDIKGVNFKTEPTAIKAFLQIDKLGTKPSFGNGHRFDATFTAGGKIVEMYAGQPDAVAAGANGALVTAGQSAPAAGGVRIAGTYNATVKLTSVFDVKTSTVILSVDRAALDKVLAGALTDGAQLTLTSAHSRIFTPTAGSALADTAQAAKPDEQVYRLGDNRCFAIVSASAPATATSLIVSAPSRVQTGDSLPVSVTFTDGAGKPQAGASITARLGNGPTASAKTDANGKAAMKVAVTGPGATRRLVVSSGAVSVRRTTTVLAERSLLNYAISGTGDTRLVTVTLTDDDRPSRHAYPGATVTFAYGGMSMTAKTDSKGQAFVRVRTGTKIDMTYAGKPGLVTSAVRRTEVE